MSKVAVMMSAERADGSMSSHFGKAEWIMVAEAESQVPAFVANSALNGRGAAGILASQGCTDVILAEIGDGALGHLQAAQIRAWAAPGPVSGVEALRLFRLGQLPAVPAARAATGHGGGHGCCCASHKDEGAAGCCHG